MSALKGIVWFVLMLISIASIFEVVGWRGLTRMFPEGHRWWHILVQYGSLAVFAALVHFNPF